MNNTRAIEAALSALEHFPRHSRDERIVYIKEDQIPLVRQLMNLGIAAAILPESDSERARREDFCTGLTEDQWRFLRQRNPKTPIGDVLDNTTAIRIPDYLREQVKQDFHRLSLVDPDMTTAKLDIYAKQPMSGVVGRYPFFHLERYPYSIHHTLLGAPFECYPGALSDFEKIHCKSDQNGFVKTLDAKRIFTFAAGDSIFFNQELLHRSSSKIPQEGQLTIVSSTLEQRTPS